MKIFGTEQKNILVLFVIPLVAAIIGSIVTLASAPLMEKLNFKYWEKRRAEEIKFVIFEKRIDTVAELQTAMSDLKYCIEKNVKDYENSSKEDLINLDQKCQTELNNFWGTGFKATLIFDRETADQLAKTQENLTALLFKTTLNSGDPTNYVNAFNESIRESIDTIQKNFWVDID